MIVNNFQVVELEDRDDMVEIRKALVRLEARLRSGKMPVHPTTPEGHQQRLERAS
jgi:hypothetical protein